MILILAAINAKTRKLIPKYIFVVENSSALKVYHASIDGQLSPSTIATQLH
jgi:hypothetical protein